MNIKSLSLLLILSLISAGSHAAKNDNKKVDVKCYVELLGGEQTIYLGHVKKKELKSLSKTLVNRKILTPFSRQKKQVYKVFECRLENKDFASSKARQLFSNYAL